MTNDKTPTQFNREGVKGGGEYVKLFEMGDRLKNQSLYVPLVLDISSAILDCKLTQKRQMHT
ncbi:hypothetical protein F7734_56375 [Scytonema sp. UIC 10036]|uniref:hypothetical protein n=1 Tax=Scytonema sp. UIC 10036 TaxID=2304196 RepID=UPI0012DAF081|nr:hypothetical protein [Scytonema sp. UIC 10036]MUH01154.1 hypothetical protein [Scytonema sp. UIC 10036]